MKLLFDQNLSFKLPSALADLFPGSLHVKDLGLKDAEDHLIWDQAKRDGLIIVSKDSDFYQKAPFFGPPPKLIWIKQGNCSTKAIASMLRHHLDQIQRFDQDTLSVCLILY